MFDLGSLADDVVALVFATLKLDELQQIGRVCKRWKFSGARTNLWYDLAEVHGVRLPRISARSLRSKTDLRSTFFAACATQHAVCRQRWDARCMRLVQLMCARDAVSALTQELCHEPQLPVTHVLDPANRCGHATLLHAACRYGRLNCATHLLNVAKGAAHCDMASPPGLSAALQRAGCTRSNPLTEITDGGGCTPLVIAAWCGHLDVVNLLLSRGAATNESCESVEIAAASSGLEGKSLVGRLWFITCGSGAEGGGSVGQGE